MNSYVGKRTQQALARTANRDRQCERRGGKGGIRRELKQLEEEQRHMLADLDDSETHGSPPIQPENRDARERLGQTRQEVGAGRILRREEVPKPWPLERGRGKTWKNLKRTFGRNF